MKIMLRRYEVILLSAIVFKLILCNAMLCIFSKKILFTNESKIFWNILAQSIKQFLEDMRSIFPSLHHHHHHHQCCFVQCKHKKNALGSIFAYISKVNQAWNEHEAWVCQGDKNYLRVGKLDNHIIGDNDSFRRSPEDSWAESRVTEALQTSTRMSKERSILEHFNFIFFFSVISTRFIMLWDFLIVDALVL